MTDFSGNGEFTPITIRAETVADDFEAGIETSAMWRALARQLRDAIPDIVIEGDPVKAVKWATCAEACFWKASGEGEAHDVKDVLPPT
jgi:hypothetical protein